MDLPAHPGTDDSPDISGMRPEANWAARIVIGLVVALVVVVILLHLTGVVGPLSQ